MRGHAAADGRPAVESFTDPPQRILISKVRTAYRIALGAENDEQEAKAKEKADQIEADTYRT